MPASSAQASMENSRFMRVRAFNWAVEWLLVVFLGSSSTMDPMVAGARGEREAMAVRYRRAANPAPSSEHAEEDTA